MNIIDGIQVPDTADEIRAWYTDAADLAAQYADDDNSREAQVARGQLSAARQAMHAAGLTTGPTGGRRRFGRRTPAATTTPTPVETPAPAEATAEITPADTDTQAAAPEQIAADVATAIRRHYADDRATRGTLPAHLTIDEEAAYHAQRTASYQAAARAVTAAIAAGVDHQRIADLAGCGAMTVIGMLHDPALRTRALVVEQHRARRHLASVEEEMRAHAQRVIGDQGGRGKAQLAREYGISRSTLDLWLVPDED